MNRSSMSKHWANKGYNSPLTEKSPLKGAYTSGADSQVYVSNRDVFDKFQSDMVNIAKEQIKKSQKPTITTLEEDLRSGKIDNATYKTLKKLEQEKGKTIKEGDFSKSVPSVDDITGTMPGYQSIGKKSYKTPGYKPFEGVSLSDQNFKSPLGMKGDLNKDGKMSLYESKRQTAIEKNMKSK